ncbi:venom allergen 5-like [Drosophila serrata]|uniref:venom allergen 5-like n=1 Tax=Drosophila serrata TaxID=7274 RepID=UPI000A1D34FE|nr:venom allergen 5-like [Drosophila serrata]KAH8357732.1 hypothetical protein KR200_002418 [Drosophila serrata]
MTFDRVLPMALLFALVSCYNYCNNKTHVCNLGGLKHFMCQLDEELAAFEGTKFLEIVPDTQYFQTEVLLLLNNFRNNLSAGQVVNNVNMTFPSAKRMRRLIWDSELAYLARVHASTVSFKHTECRSTLRFPFVGEIMSMMEAPVDRKLTVVNVLMNAFRPMWKQHWMVLDPESLSQGFDPVRDFLVGDFALFINDRISRVGCSIATGANCPYKGSIGYCHFLTCYFDYNNIVNSSVYKAGQPTSGCGDWKTTGNADWINLCKNEAELSEL